MSFWLPGIFGSLAAVPQQQPGWAFSTWFYHTTVSAGGDVALAREFETHRVPDKFSGTLNASLHSTADLQFVDPTYAFATPVFGGQLSLGLMALYGRVSTDLSGTLTGTTDGFPFPPRSDSFSDSVTGFGDLYPQAFLRWNAGVDNYVLYATGDIPVGAYDSARLSNIGIGHGAIDTGGGYTYFDPKTGHEFSVVTGFTYNFTNPTTNYQNGVDWHLDWGASQFLSKQFSVGLVGYFYDQVSADSGSGDSTDYPIGTATKLVVSPRLTRIRIARFDCVRASSTNFLTSAGVLTACRPMSVLTSPVRRPLSAARLFGATLVITTP